MSEIAEKNELIPQVLDALKVKVTEFNFNNWFRLSRWSVEEPSRVRIRVPSKFVRDWILDNYLQIIKFELFKVTNLECEVVVQVDAQAQQDELNFKKPVEVVPAKKEVSVAVKEVKTASSPESDFSSRYHFENFVVGNSNQFVHAACKAVATNPAKNYNPLFIYGGVGLGKTHLLNAIGYEVSKKNPHAKVILVSGEQFTNEVINSIRYDKTYDFRKKYRFNCDVLLIDDVQFIAGKERTMEEFFHTFNNLYDARKQIVLTSDTLPKDIPHLEERLRSRFSWGLLADIQLPDFETRCAILRKKAEEEKIDIPDDVCQFIASHIKTNVRDLEGCLVRVSAFASLASVKIDVPLATQVLRNIQHGFSQVHTIESVQETVANFFQLKVSDLKSPRRHKNLAVPRQIAMFLCKKHVKSSYPEIGFKFGGKDHTTVLHAVRKMSGCPDPQVIENISRLESLLSKGA